MTPIATRRWRRWMAVPVVAASLLAASPAMAQDVNPPRWDVVADVPYRPKPAPVSDPATLALVAAAVTGAASGAPMPNLNAMIAFSDQAGVSDVLLSSHSLELASTDWGLLLLIGITLAEGGDRQAAEAMARSLSSSADSNWKLAGQALAYAMGGALPDRPPVPRSGRSQPDESQAWLRMVSRAGVVRILAALDATDTQQALQLAAQAMADLEQFRSNSPFPGRFQRPDGFRLHEAGAVISALQAGGHLAEAAAVVVQSGLLERCNRLSDPVADLISSLANAGRWSEALALIARSDLSCLTHVLGHGVPMEFLRAGKGAELGAVISAVLAAHAEGGQGDDPLARKTAERLTMNLAIWGFTQQAHDFLVAQRQIGHIEDESLWGLLAVSAIISGDQAMAQRYWAILDEHTGGDAEQIAYFVAMMGIACDPGGPWRARAKAWLGLDDEVLDRATARAIRHLSPEWVVGDPALSHLVRTVLASGIEASLSMREGEERRLELAKSRLELLLAAGAKAHVLRQLEAGLTDELPLLIAAAKAATTSLDDAALMRQLMDLAEARLIAPERPGPRDNDYSARNGACTVAVVALDLAQTRAEAIGRLTDGAGLSGDPMLQLCRLSAVRTLALLGDRAGAMAMVRLIDVPSLALLAEALAFARPVGSEWEAWNAQMNRNGLRTPVGDGEAP